jgi:ubiquinol-cytochrome c reductase iron-sulfur subunit
MSPDKSLYSRIWKGGQRLVTSDGTPLSLESLVPGSMATVFPEDQIGDERAQTVLIRVKESLLQLPEDRATWAPSGYVAYSRVCTHAGCPVGEYEAEQSVLLCPCHQSTFDVLRAAAPTGGPAARPLPQLPLYADADGTLRAGGGFTAPPGPGFWGIS